MTSYQPVPSSHARNHSERLGASTNQAWSGSPGFGSKSRTLACGERQSTQAYMAQPQWDIGRTPFRPRPVRVLTSALAVGEVLADGSWFAGRGAVQQGQQAVLRAESAVAYTQVEVGEQCGQREAEGGLGLGHGDRSTGSGSEGRPHGRTAAALAATLSSNCAFSVMRS